MFSRLAPYQRVNNFPAAGEISRKDNMARNLGRLNAICPEEYDFVPKSWIVPAEYSTLLAHDSKEKKASNKRCYIVKPVNSAMGKGIFLIMSPAELYAHGNLAKGDSAIVQEYLTDPLLLDEFKFDLRVYVLITCCDPLRVHIYKDGLVRLSTQEYVEPTAANVKDLFMYADTFGPRYAAV